MNMLTDDILFLACRCILVLAKLLSDDVLSYNILLISTIQSIYSIRGGGREGKRVLYNFRGGGSPKLLYNVIRVGRVPRKLTFFALGYIICGRPLFLKKLYLVVSLFNFFCHHFYLVYICVRSFSSSVLYVCLAARCDEGEIKFKYSLLDGSASV